MKTTRTTIAIIIGAAHALHINKQSDFCPAT
jgi:hypothetical protein